ncbi:hypothetical protein RIF29_20303 [Crotalaria pallida]|uniref:Uncharacterized protein n=1 Tax=Crotalaria pallida TaxID=3830 RepID=A0AAN9I8J6_CROPI
MNVITTLTEVVGLGDWYGMRLVLALMLQLVNLCIIGFAVAVQGSKGSIISPSSAFLPVIPPTVEALGPIHHGEYGGSNAPSLPSDPDGLVISPSSIVLSPPHDVVPSPSTVQGNVPPSVKSSPPPSEEPAVKEILTCILWSGQICILRNYAR